MRTSLTLLWLLCLLFAPLAPAEIVEVRLSNNRFTPNDLTINAGDTVRFINDQGFHDVRADDGSYGNTPAGPGWVFERVYAAPGVYRVYCTLHASPGGDINTSMNARITVRAAEFAISQGLNGTWVNPNNLGQGFLFDFSTGNRFMFGAWFTYETAAPASAIKLGATTHRWLTLQGNYTGNAVALQVFSTAGGVFNTPTSTTTTQVGTATLTFTSCTQGSLAFTLTEPPLSGTIPLQKALPAFGSECATAAPAP